MKTNKKGFTLIELLVVIAIIGLLATLSVVALNSARSKSRDAKRVADIKQAQTALEMYYNAEGNYPATLTQGASIASGTNVYGKFPTAPTPQDGNCTAANNTYVYNQRSTGTSYTIEYCLGSNTGNITAGYSTATPATMKN